VDADNVVGASGTSMANFIAMSALIGPGDEVLIEHPVYEPLLAVAKYLRADIKRFPREARLRDFVSKRTRLIVLTNLHNPTSALIGEDALNEIADIANSAGARVLMDEVYLECMYEKMDSAFRRSDGFVCTSSLTKAYGLGGLRCGWILARPDLARRLRHFKDLIDSTAPHAVQQLAVIAFKNLNGLASRANTILDRNREILRGFMRSCLRLELSIPEYGTCVFPRMNSGDSDRLFDLLQTKFETDVVPGRFFEKPEHFRLGIGGSSEVLVEGLHRLGKALELLQG
jgi:aspartate/methionine/tyrosine aminotransferase